MAKKKKAKKLEPTQTTTNTSSSGSRPIPKKKRKPIDIKQTLIFAAIGLAMLAFIFGPYLRNISPGVKKGNTPKSEVGKVDENVPEPQFRKDGELYLLASNKTDTLERIDIEIVKDEASITQGLMYRKSMLDNRGMLFIMPQMGPQSFWMKNTYIPLDIIFINHNRQIVTIHKNTEPFSEKSLASSQNAKFVVEVNGGYCDKNGVKVGDFVKF